MQARTTTVSASDRRGGDLIGVDDVVARDLVAFERTACPLWTLPARFLHSEAAPSFGTVLRPNRWRYSLTAMKPTTFDSPCICRMILPTSSFGSLASDRRMR